MTSIIAHKSVKTTKSHEEFMKCVKDVMELANWKKYIKGNKIFIKVNLISNKLMPGQCTSPWILEGVIRTIKETNPDSSIIVGDSDVATICQLDQAAKIWGITDICKKYSVSFVNLSKEKTINIPVKNGKILKNVNIPHSVYISDNFITIPVVKTHSVTQMTCALKNQWGGIPRFRHNFHPFVHQVIPEINTAISPDFVIVDATISMEGAGPNTGIPKATNSIFASNDLVAMDTLIAKFMGINPYEVEYISNSRNIGLGTMDYTICGDDVELHKFKPATLSNTPFAYLEMKFRKIPGLNWLIFKTPLFRIPAFIASRYNSIFWYYTKGKSYKNKIMKEEPLYKTEFESLMLCQEPPFRYVKKVQD